MNDSPRGAGADTGLDVNCVPVEEVLDNLAYMHRDSPKAKIDPTINFCFDGDQLPAPRKMLIPDVMPAEGIAFIGGQSGAGKTFIAILMSVCLASGKSFFGRQVKERVGAVIVAAEGKGMVPARIAAAKRELGIEEPLPIAWLRTLPNFGKPKGVEEFIGELRAAAEKMRREHHVRLGIVLVDTVSANFEIKKEEDNAEAAEVCRILRRIADPMGAVAAPVHHYGKNIEAGLRGASAWRANADFVLSVLADINPVTGEVSNRSLAASKDREGAQGPLTRFSLKFVRLGQDDDGKDWGTMVAVPEEGTVSVSKPGWPEKLNVFRQALQVALLDHGKEQRPFGADGPLVRAVDVRMVREEFFRISPLDDAPDQTEAQIKDACRNRCNRALDIAQAKGLVGIRVVDGGRTLVWLVHEHGDQNPHSATD
jgi:AAA domain